LEYVDFLGINEFGTKYFSQFKAKFKIQVIRQHDYVIRLETVKIELKSICDLGNSTSMYLYITANKK